MKLPSDLALEQKILREVTIWGRLSHPGIVRYHTSWVETDTMSTDVKQALDMLTSSTNGSLHTDDTDDSDLDGDESTSVGASDSGETASEDGHIGEDEFDMGFDDLDFISKGHQSKSLSMPTIHFGNEDDPSAEASRVTSRHDSPIAPTPPVVSPRQSRTLYIQMEVSVCGLASLASADISI